MAPHRVLTHEQVATGLKKGRVMPRASYRNNVTFYDANTYRVLKVPDAVSVRGTSLRLQVAITTPRMKLSNLYKGPPSEG